MNVEFTVDICRGRDPESDDLPAGERLRNELSNLSKKIEKEAAHVLVASPRREVHIRVIIHDGSSG